MEDPGGEDGGLRLTVRTDNRAIMAISENGIRWMEDGSKRWVPSLKAMKAQRLHRHFRPVN